jgi:outer membrane protein assembly factor BamE
MRPIRYLASARRAVVLFAFGALLAGSGCVYRLDIQQGNLLDIEQIDQVQAGMTRSQVRYLLGTPMINDPFAALRWDYVFTYQRGRKREIDRGHFVVYFEGDTVARVEKLDLTKLQEYQLANPARAAAAPVAPAASPDAAVAPAAPAPPATPATPAEQPPGA